MQLALSTTVELPLRQGNERTAITTVSTTVLTETVRVRRCASRLFCFFLYAGPIPSPLSVFVRRYARHAPWTLQRRVAGARDAVVRGTSTCVYARSLPGCSPHASASRLLAEARSSPHRCGTCCRAPIPFLHSLVLAPSSPSLLPLHPSSSPRTPDWRAHTSPPRTSPVFVNALISSLRI